LTPEPSTFLTPAEVAEFTGIKRGTDGITRTMRQSLALSRMGIHHYVNAIDRVIVARAVIEGKRGTQPAAPEPRLRPIPRSLRSPRSR
jgi:hypothetical protein